MSEAADRLRHAADVVEGMVLAGRTEKVIRLMALHIIRSCGSPDCAEEARLLIDLLEDSE